MRSLGLALVVLTPLVAHADEKIERADALFEEAKRLLDTDLHAACAKFDESYALNPHAIGTLLNVARCDERLGRLASAQAKFMLARDMAAEQKLPAHAKAANEHLAKIAPRVPHVSITATTTLPPDATVIIDGTVVGHGAIDRLPIDPGTHQVVVTAAGYAPFRQTFAVAEVEHRTVEIRGLEKSITARGRRQTIGLITAGTGAAVGLTGIVLGLVARSRYHGATSCHEAGDLIQCDDADDYRTVERALTLGNVGTVVGIAGGVAIGVGAALWFTGRRAPDEQRVVWLPHVTADGAGIAAVGRF